MCYNSSYNFAYCKTYFTFMLNSNFLLLTFKPTLFCPLQSEIRQTLAYNHSSCISFRREANWRYRLKFLSNAQLDILRKIFCEFQLKPSRCLGGAVIKRFGDLLTDRHGVIAECRLAISSLPLNSNNSGNVLNVPFMYKQKFWLLLFMIYYFLTTFS